MEYLLTSTLLVVTRYPVNKESESLLIRIQMNKENIMMFEFGGESLLCNVMPFLLLKICNVLGPVCMLYGVLL